MNCSHMYVWMWGTRKEQNLPRVANDLVPILLGQTIVLCCCELLRVSQPYVTNRKRGKRDELKRGCDSPFCYAVSPLLPNFHSTFSMFVEEPTDPTGRDVWGKPMVDSWQGSLSGSL